MIRFIAWVAMSTAIAASFIAAYYIGVQLAGGPL